MELDDTLGVKQLLNMWEHTFPRTSSIENLKDNSVVFVKSKKWLNLLESKLEGNTIEVVALCDAIFWTQGEMDKVFKARARPVFVWDMMKKFVLYHNEVNKNRHPVSHVFASDCTIHPSAVIGVEGMRYVMDDGNPVLMKHMGNVVIEPGVDIGPYSVLQRATMDSTVIGRNTKLGTYSNIGHNVQIGYNCFLTAVVTVGGSTVIGNNVWIGMQAAIADNLKICSDVKIGMGSRVVKDITEPGTYFGCPATRRGDYDGKI